MDSKDKAVVLFRRFAYGEVIGEIFNADGLVVVSRSFGIMSEHEYLKILKILQTVHSDITTIELGRLSEN